MSFLKKFLTIFNTTPSTPVSRFPGVVVGEILEVKSHPQADRLQIAVVNTGETLQIVCGAPNIAVGQLVPVATIGTILPNGLTITKATIRGVDSFGMLCAEDELGLGNDHSGILILKAGTVGQPIDASITN